MKKGYCYKHINNKDVCIYVNNITDFEDKLYVNVSWYNIVFKPFFIDFDGVFIKKEDIKNWKLYAI